MSSEGGGLRGMLRRAASLMVELPPEDQPEAEDGLDAAPRPTAAPVAPTPTPKTVEQIARDLPGPNLEDIKVQPQAAQAQPVGPDGTIDFQAVYAAASVPSSGFTAEQVRDMIEQLPADLALDAKRQTMKVSLATMGRALGVTPETIVADASRKFAAIAAYEEQHRGLTAQLIATSNDAIARLENQIAERKRNIALAQARSAQIDAQCTAEAKKLEDVLEFFSQDVPPSRNAPGGAAK